MLFNSIDFLFFFPVVTIIFFVIPSKLRCVWLLIASYYFYMSWNPKYALLMGCSTLITYLSGLLMNRYDNIRLKKLFVAGSMISNLTILAVFKYANFVLDTLSTVMTHMGLSTIDKRLDLLLPVGISFYTFQALSYTMDVYRGSIKAEKNIVRYALFVSFFPQLVAGPIERSGHLLEQIQRAKEIRWNYERIRDGLLLMFWGLFQKLFISDRASLLVNEVYNNYSKYGFLEIAIATVLFAIQIYCDFGGYTNIARGAAKVMGFELMQNFRQPYLATSIKEFWRRWHISLTSWFTDYLYIPLGGNRKGILRKYFNIFVVFGISGLWHGASWNYIAWGLLHAVYQILGDIKGKFVNRYLPQRECVWGGTFSQRLRKVIITFVLVDIAWVFFVASGFRTALHILRQMFQVFQTTSVYAIGLNRGNWAMLLFGIVILLIVDILHEQGKSIFKLVNEQEIWFRGILYLGLVWSVIMFGVYGIGYDTSEFIYFQF